VHHDVKPANVLWMAPGVPVLADFGIARRVGEPSPPGSPGYVSPERLAGRESDPRDDVFGFGRVLLVEMAHGGGEAEHEAWRTLAAACTGPDEGRPPDGAALVRWIDGDRCGRR
jgi:serine/threonine protein kinase